MVLSWAMTKTPSLHPSNGLNVPTFLSLYSGAGGLDLGVARAGFRPVFANDIDPDAIATHRRLAEVQDPDWVQTAALFSGHTAIAADVRSIGDHFYPGMSDLVVGGPPCQGFSVAGLMNPDDPRSKHVFDFLGIVSTIKPRAFIMENVAALARNRRWADIVDALKAKAGECYKVDLVVLNAAHWGVPQSRERMFLIGTPVDGPELSWPEPPTASDPQTARDALMTLPPAGRPGNDSVCTAKITLAKNPVLRKSPFAGMLFNGQGRVIDLDKPSQTLPASMGGNRTPIVDMDQLDGGNAWVESYHRRLFYENGTPLSEVPKDARMRRLTVQEAAVLQTFPRDVSWQGKQSARFRQIGNAVPPLLGYAVASVVREAMGV